jgi:glutamate 5-kinase
VRTALLQNIRRLVVKLGTGVLTDGRKQPDLAQIRQLVAQVAELRKAGHEVVLVTSGAVGAGMGVLGFDRRPSGQDELQACAAVGQSRLMATYEKLFARYDLHVGQVLLTHDDLEHHARHLNARNTLVTLLRKGVIPIINENDTVSITELRFGDNDKLSALVAALLPADLLVILTTVDGVVEHFGTEEARLLPVIERIDGAVEKIAGGTTSATAVGGMSSKIMAAKIAVRAGIPLVIASGRKKTVLRRILAGEDEGTLFVPGPNRLRGRKRWIAFFHHPKGTLKVDDGAQRALRDRGKSLLPPGIRDCTGAFLPGDVVRICDLEGVEFARGIVRYPAAEVSSGHLARTEVVHRDDLVIL